MQIKENVTEERTAVVAGTEIRYMVCSPWPDGMVPAMYDEEGNIYVSGTVAEADPDDADLSVLQTGVPGSMRAYAIMSGEGWYWRPNGNLLRSVTNGVTAFDDVFNEGFFDYLSKNDEASQVFNDVMSDLTGMILDVVVEAYDFSGFGKVVDVGGGHGAMLAAILKTNPETRGVLFNLPSVTASARDASEEQRLTTRCEVVSGDFFDSVPSGGDAYVLKWIIHDWDDDRSIRILKNCRRAMSEGAKLLLLEKEIPVGNEPSPGKIADIGMLVMTGGKERTEAEYRALLGAAGFSLKRVLQTKTAISVIESVPA